MRFGSTFQRVTLALWLLIPIVLGAHLLSEPPTAAVASISTESNARIVPEVATEETVSSNDLAVTPFELPTSDIPDEVTLTTDQLGLGRSVQVARPAGRTTMTVPVPDGMVLTEINTTLVVPSGLHETFVAISVNDEEVFSQVVSGGSRLPISAQVEPAAGDVLVDIQAEEYHAGVECTSTVIEPRAAELLDLSFELKAQPTLPSTVAEFFPAVIDRFDIYVPEDRSPGLDESVLVLATELSRQYPSLPAFQVLPITSDIQDRIDSDPFVRSIALTETDEGSVKVIGDTRAAYLHISGPAYHLTSVSAAVGSPELGLITAPAVDTAGSRIDDDQSLPQRRTLREAGIRNLEASGGVRLQLALPLPQARFGQPVEKIRVRLGGVVFHTGANVDDPTVTIWVNGDLFGSIDLDEGGRFDTDVDINGSNLRRDNVVEIRSDLPLNCGDGLPTHELQLDASSWIDVDFGQTLPVGLGRFPQVLLPGFQVSPGTTLAELEVTANLLASMQFTSPVPIEPHVAAWNEIVGGHRAGILVGGSPDQVDLLGLPIQAGSGSMIVDGVTFDAGIAYDDVAVLQAIVGPEGQDLLHLRLSLDDVDNVSADELAFRLSDRSWELFDGRAFAMHEEEALAIPLDAQITGDSTLPALRSDRPPPIQRSFGAGILIMLAVCLVFLAVRSVSGRLRRG